MGKKPFSRQAQLERANETKLRRARILAKEAKPGVPKNITFKTDHADWYRDANLEQPNYAAMEAKVLEETQKVQENYIIKKQKERGSRNGQ